MYEMYDGPLYNYVHFVIVLETKLLIKYLWLENNLETNWSVIKNKNPPKSNFHTKLKTYSIFLKDFNQYFGN